MPQKIWAVGEEVLASDFNSYLQQQVVAAFPNTATRDSQWTSPPNGAMCVTTDTNTIWRRVVATWIPLIPTTAYGEALSVGAPINVTTDVMLLNNVTASYRYKLTVSAVCHFGLQGATNANVKLVRVLDGATTMTVAASTAAGVEAAVPLVGWWDVQVAQSGGFKVQMSNVVGSNAWASAHAVYTITPY